MAIDFIVKLSPFIELIIRVEYDFILIITNRPTKYGYFISYKESLSAEELVYAFNKYRLRKGPGRVGV
jgi:hypothetical protein